MTINPIVDPVFTLDLVLIEPSRRGDVARGAIVPGDAAGGVGPARGAWAAYLAGKDKRQAPEALPAEAGHSPT